MIANNKMQGKGGKAGEGNVHSRKFLIHTKSQHDTQTRAYDDTESISDDWSNLHFTQNKKTPRKKIHGRQTTQSKTQNLRKVPGTSVGRRNMNFKGTHQQFVLECTNKPTCGEITSYSQCISRRMNTWHYNIRTCQRNRSRLQWSIDSTFGCCVRGPRIESRCVFHENHCDMQRWVGGCTFTAVSRLIQRCTRHGM